MKRVIVLTAALALAAPAAAPAGHEPLTMPGSTANEKRCKSVTRNGYRFRVWVVRGAVSCRAARRVVREGIDARGWTYYDWTKGGNGPWSDVWARDHNRKTIGAVINA